MVLLCFLPHEWLIKIPLLGFQITLFSHCHYACFDAKCLQLTPFLQFSHCSGIHHISPLLWDVTFEQTSQNPTDGIIQIFKKKSVPKINFNTARMFCGCARLIRRLPQFLVLAAQSLNIPLYYLPLFILFTLKFICWFLPLDSSLTTFFPPSFKWQSCFR